MSEGLSILPQQAVSRCAVLARLLGQRSTCTYQRALEGHFFGEGILDFLTFVCFFPAVQHVPAYEVTHAR